MEDITIMTQARVNSTRLPSKVLKQINGQSLLSIHLQRLKNVKSAAKIIVATTLEPEVDQILDIANMEGVNIFQGSTEDVLDRFYQAVKDKPTNYIVRVTSDCPLVDPLLIDNVVNFAIFHNADYVTNCFNNKFPDGQDVEVFKFSALEKAWKDAKLPSEREHVTPYIRKHSNLQSGSLFSALNFPIAVDYSAVRMTVDHEEDFRLIEKLINDLGIDKDWRTYTKHIIDNNLSSINGGIIRNEGYLKSIIKDHNE